MHRFLSVMFLAALVACLSGCGSSPREAGRAFAKGVISSADSGDPSAAQTAAAAAQAKTRNMSPGDAAEFMQGYQEVVTPWIQSKLAR